MSSNTKCPSKYLYKKGDLSDWIICYHHKNHGGKHVGYSRLAGKEIEWN